MITGSSAVGHDRRFKISRPHARGQSLVEFAIVLPVLLVLVGGAVQFGVIFAAKNGLTQVTRDIARWAATQTYDPCNSAATATPPQPLTQADSIASVSSLIGYSSGAWNSGNFRAYPGRSALPLSQALPSPPTDLNGDSVEVVWSYATGACPPSDNSTAAFVTVRVTHKVPLLLAGLQYMPGLGTCDPDCHIALSSTSTFRMEPPPQ
jgi:TadE-like protein